MTNQQKSRLRVRPPRAVTAIGGRAVSLTLKPLSAAATVAVSAGRDLERAAVERVRDSPEVERLVASALDSARIHSTAVQVFESDAAKQVVAAFFESGLWDELAARLLASDALWDLIDTIVDSPHVTAAITQQSLGFADQVGDEVRMRSRRADDWLERAARRLARRP